MKVKILCTSRATNARSVKFSQILDAVTSDGKTHKLKIDIESGSPIGAHINRYNGEEWKYLGHIPQPLMKTNDKLLYRAETENDFTEDRAELLKIAKVILE